MSGKFMKVKRIVVPTLTMLLIASQLCGCSAASQSEMHQMLQNQQTITIEVAEPINVEQGEEKQFEWLELAALTTYSDFRDTVDDIMGVTAFGEGGKSGVIYIDAEGNHTNNSTLYYAFNNQKFLDKVWNNTDATKAIIEAVKENYADIESDAQAKVAFINAYYNLINDAEPNYFNGGSTITRAEFMSALYKATNPVQELSANEQFASLVDPSNANENTLFASQIADYSYLDVASKSLNDQTFDGTITRAEAIYTLVKMYYNAEYESLTGKETAYSDTKNAGDIASKQGFVTTDKKTGEVTQPTYWKSYELSYSIMNADKGMASDLYKAMVVAKNHNLINGSESRWDEGLTKGECISLITTVFEDLGTKVAVDRGQAQGEVIDNSENTVTTEDNEISDVNAVDTLEPTAAITDNGDGTYTFSEEFISTMSTYDYFIGATEEQIVDYLNDLAGSLKNVKAQEIHTIVKMLGEDFRLVDSINIGKHNIDTSQETSTPAENTKPSTDNNSGNTDGNSNNNNGGSNSTGGTESTHVTPEPQQPSGGNNSGNTDTGFDSLIQNPDGTMTSPDGSFTFDDPSSFGGDGTNIDDTGATLNAGG